MLPVPPPRRRRAFKPRPSTPPSMASGHHLFEIEATVLSPTRPTSCFGSTVTPSWSSCIGGYDWQCDYYTDPHAGTVSFTLALPSGNVREPLNARFKLSLLDREGRPAPSRTRASSFQNWSPQQSWEWPCASFITSKDLERPELLKDGNFTVRCDVALRAFGDKQGDGGFVRVPPSDLHQHLGNLLGSKEGADVTFVVADGETFAAHRCVIAARSPVFSAQLFGQMKESKMTTAGGGDGGGVIEIDDMEARVFGFLLHFIYTDSLLPEVVEKKGKEDDDDEGECRMVLYQHLLVAADRYGLERMKLICQEKLCGYICPKSVASMLVLADRHHCPGLKEACIDFLSSSTNLESFTETDGFEVLTDSCPAVLKELLAKLSTVLIFD